MSVIVPAVQAGHTRESQNRLTPGRGARQEKAKQSKENLEGYPVYRLETEGSLPVVEVTVL